MDTVLDQLCLSVSEEDSDSIAPTQPYESDEDMDQTKSKQGVNPIILNTNTIPAVQLPNKQPNKLKKFTNESPISSVPSARAKKPLFGNTPYQSPSTIAFDSLFDTPPAPHSNLHIISETVHKSSLNNTVPSSQTPLVYWSIPTTCWWFLIVAQHPLNGFTMKLVPTGVLITWACEIPFLPFGLGIESEVLKQSLRGLTGQFVIEAPKPIETHTNLAHFSTNTHVKVLKIPYLMETATEFK